MLQSEEGSRPLSTLVRDGIVVPLTGGRTALDPGSVSIDRTLIVALGPVAERDVAEG